MPSARKWPYLAYPGVVDYLEAPYLITTPPPSSKMTFCCWVNVPTDVIADNYTLWVGPACWLKLGLNSGGSDGGMALIRGTLGDFISVSDNFSGLGFGSFSGQNVFLACSSNTIGISFYAGITPASIGNLGLDRFGPAWQSFSGFPSYLGETVVGATSGQFYGTMNQAALWWGTQLTLAQIKSFAGGCAGTSSLTDSAAFYYPITGASPEPDFSLTGNSGIIHGTLTVVAGICGGAALGPSANSGELLICL